ncbi:MAG: radical SAM protein, partial [bacterium]
MMKKYLKIAWFGKHFGEEPPLVGNEKQGSGAIFFSGCNLRCVFCQNCQISQEMMGTDYSIEELADIMIKLQDDGAVNINLVTPTIWWRQIKNALLIAEENGLKIPVAWNSNGYDKIEILKEMEGLIDIYLPDFKYGIDEIGFKYSGVKNYSQTAISAIKEMLSQVGNLEIDENGIAKKGLIVRHLILPNNLNNSFSAFKLLSEIDADLYISLMRQYLPLHKASLYPEITRMVRDDEFEKVYEEFLNLGFSNGWVQEGKCENIFVPDFRKQNP